MINVHAGMNFLKMYSYARDKKSKDEAIVRYYDDIQLYPFQKADLLRLLDEANIDNSSIKLSLITSFDRTRNTGIMTSAEAADFIIYELSGEVEKSRELSYKLAQAATKKIKSYR
ncbi:MAG: hypothetical protein IJR96_01850 [Pseudobutyrivibrio sp.]|uniref:Uncharacterized protein n=1 Tax=Pseudobutyrivibrio xylanivorans TaxID=185007 RepID=A0A5P6VNI3_PSEXY|nr:hypothetical protein [Pseudobutyrivibrio sp.]QFJ54137.1 hypothetical protein FXF36_04240 [Pseudobutyrivibrio xylanivorans]